MAAQDAELKLKVSLDLGFFRQQLAGLGQAAAGYNIPVQVKFDRRSVLNELNALSANIRKREYRLTIQTNLAAEIKNAKALANALNDIAQGSTAIKGVAGKGGPGGLAGTLIDDKATYRQLQALYRFADKAQLPFEKLTRGAASKTSELRRVLSAAFNNVGDDVKTGIASSLKDANSDLAKLGKDMGASLLKAVKSELGIASPSKEFKKIGEDSGEGLEQGLKIGFGEAGDVGVREIEKLFQRLQKEAKAGSALLQAIMAGAMSGVMQLPGRQRGAGGSIGPMIRQQRAQVQAERQAQAGGMSALMMGMMGGVIPMGGTPRGAGGSISAMIRQQRTAVQAQKQAQAGSLSALMIAMMSGVVPMGGKPRGAGGSIKELIQKERAKVREQNRPLRIESLIAALSSARGNLSPAAGVNQRLATGGAINPGVLSSGYIGRSALSPKFVNYPAGMPPAYATGFIEPTAFGSLAAGTTGRMNMAGTTAFPSSPMMRGGIGAGGGSFIPMQEVAKASSQAKISLTGFTQRLKTFANFITGEDLLNGGIDERRYATRAAAGGGILGGRFVGAGGVTQSYRGNFRTSGMMNREGITADEAGFRGYAIRKNAIGGRFPLGAPYAGRTGSIGNYAFPMSGMMGPSSPLGRITAQSSNFGAGGIGGGWFGGFRNYGGGGNVPPGGGGGGGGFMRGMGGMGGFGRAMAGVNLPGSGTVRELGSEFAFATKQVLLFGQAYKLLGFFQDLPGQVSDAVSKLQSFRNTLEAVTPSAQEAKASNEAILDLVEKYNVPLQSARDGFTKLYASMEPAGFNGDQIRGLFTGITKAAATFGMSADKVDRVNYAFAQMASKGQVMSEELKGQLGDVLPGAMAIFAQAAGFKGPKAIADFSAALEEGRYKGEAMVALLNNVSIVMNAKFAAGAQGAASTFQGAMNNMQTSLQLFYQSFEPLAVQFLNVFVTPIANGLKTVTDGLNAFFTGAAAETSGGFAIARELESLKTSFNGIKATLFDLLYQFKLLAQGALQLAKVLLQIAGNPIIGFFIQLYAQALLVTTVLRALIALPLVQAFVSFGRQIIALSASMNSLSSTTVSTRIQLGLLASGANGTGIAFSGAARQATVFGVALRAALGATVIGAIVIGLGLLIQKFVEMGQRLDDVKAKAQGAAQAIRSMSRTEARTEEQKRQSGVRLLERLSTRQGVNYRKTGTSAATNMVPIDEQEAAQLEALGIPVQRSPIPGMKGGMISRQSIAGSIQQQQDLMREAQYTQTRVKFDEQQAEQQLKNLAPIPEGGGDGKTKKGEKTPLKAILDLENERGARMRASDRERRLQELIRNAKLAGNEGEAESLENLSKALDIQGKIATLQKYRDELLEKEDQIVGKNLTRKEYDNKLQEANVKLHELSNDLKIAFYDLQVKEAGAAKKAQDDLNKKIEKQKELNRLIEDAQIEAGIISPQDAAVRLQQRGFEDAQAKIKAEGTPEQLTQLTAAQALIPEAGSLQEAMKTLRDELDKLLSTQEMVKSSAASIGEAFSTSFKNAITGASSAQEALVGFFQSVGNAFADMAAQMIQKMIQIYILDQFLKILPGAGGAFTGNASIQGGGFGSFSGGDFSAGGVPGLPGLGGAGALAGGGGVPSYAGLKFANGGIALGGFKAFANGGMVTGPTLGLVGEGRYNEAVVPLPDGKTIPVDLGNAAGNQIVSNITVNVNNGQAQSNASGSNSSDLGRKLEGAVKQVIVGELRPGGLLAR